MLSQHLLAFLETLQDEKYNNVSWMHANKDLYTLVRQEFVAYCDSLLQTLKKYDQTLIDVQIKDCLFRINKDVRFSNDKRPYKTNWSCLIAPGGKNGATKNGYAGYYLHIEPGGKSMIGGGVYNPPLVVRNMLRKYLDTHYQELQDVFLTKERKPLLPYLHIEHGYITKKFHEHPAKELAMIKNLYMMYPLDDKLVTSTDLTKTVMNTWKNLVSFHQLINDVIDTK